MWCVVHVSGTCRVYSRERLGWCTRTALRVLRGGYTRVRVSFVAFFGGCRGGGGWMPGRLMICFFTLFVPVRRQICLFV